MHLTMINMFLNVIASIIVLVNPIISLSYASRLLIKIVRLRNERAISEFYLVQVFFAREWYFDEIFEILQNFQKNKIKREIIVERK